jgi:peptidoglycan/LPS O-acetylase OafA/YrhL
VAVAPPGKPPAQAPAVRRAHSDRRRDIQGLRALAVIAVIGNHVIPWPVGGFAGVDIFFVVSGFLITGILLREHGRTGRISLWSFYANRLRRILPAAVVVLVVTAAIGSALFNQTRALATSPRCSSRPTGVSPRSAPITSTPPLRRRRCSTSGRWPSRSSSTWSGRG